ncbi:MAG: SDR family oxidoreductase, partial [Acidimicrobiales bacterium]|nr:SDR family oxidoreductase [Acidimicrobiales bacterium]
GGGIGRGIAAAMAAAGARVVVAARRAENGEPAAAELRSAGHQAAFFRCDVTQRDDLAATVEFAVEHFGRLDCLVHNAIDGVTRPTPVQELLPETWDAVRATALRAMFDAAQIAFGELRKSRGAFVIITSSSGMEGSVTAPGYAMVKAAQRGFAKCLAREWGPHGVRVNLLSPLALTPAMALRLADSPTFLEKHLARVPLGRMGDPAADIGPAAVFLASDLARYTTGHTIMVDGGEYMGL